MAFKDIIPHDDLPWRDNAVYLAASTVARGQSRIGGLFVWLYRWRPLRHSIMRLCRRVESSLMFSVSWRRVLQQYHGVEVGAYSYGDVLRAGALPPGSKVGRYCSVGQYLIVRRRDHPVESVIMHPVFYNHKLGFLLHDTIPDESENPLIVGHGVWIGDRVTVLGGCRSIGNGAVVAAGSVVTRDVEPYSIVGGVPARKIKSRFSDSDCCRIESSEWWNIDLDELITMLSE